MAELYEIPDPEEFKGYLKKKDLTAARAAAFTGVNLRTVQRWVAPAGQKGARTIPWAAWTLIRILAGDIDPAELENQIDTEAEKERGTRHESKQG